MQKQKIDLLKVTQAAGEDKNEIACSNNSLNENQISNESNQ
jgi:hypothetical protein